MHTFDVFRAITHREFSLLVERGNCALLVDGDQSERRACPQARHPIPLYLQIVFLHFQLINERTALDCRDNRISKDTQNPFVLLIEPGALAQVTVASFLIACPQQAHQHFPVISYLLKRNSEKRVADARGAAVIRVPRHGEMSGQRLAIVVEQLALESDMAGKTATFSGSDFEWLSSFKAPFSMPPTCLQAQKPLLLYKKYAADFSVQDVRGALSNKLQACIEIGRIEVAQDPGNPLRKLFKSLDSCLFLFIQSSVCNRSCNVSREDPAHFNLFFSKFASFGYGIQTERTDYLSVAYDRHDQNGLNAESNQNVANLSHLRTVHNLRDLKRCPRLDELFFQTDALHWNNQTLCSVVWILCAYFSGRAVFGEQNQTAVIDADQLDRGLTDRVQGFVQHQ